MTSKTATRSAELEAAFNTAQATLLAPYSLDDNALQQVFGQIMSHQVDYADLYFQYSRSEGWSLEEGIVKSGSFSIDQGVGVRAVAGASTMPTSLMRYCRITRARQWRRRLPIFTRVPHRRER